jgi:phage gp36-like protein
MPYITQTEMAARFGESEIDELTGETDSFVRAEAHAAAVIDGYLASRYTLPLVEPVPELVKAWAADLVRYNLWDERSPEEVRRRHETALEQLKLLAQGKISLPPNSDSTVQAAADTPVYYSAERVFTADSLKNF